MTTSIKSNELYLSNAIRDKLCKILALKEQTEIQVIESTLDSCAIYRFASYNYDVEIRLVCGQDVIKITDVVFPTSRLDSFTEFMRELCFYLKTQPVTSIYMLNVDTDELDSWCVKHGLQLETFDHNVAKYRLDLAQNHLLLPLSFSVEEMSAISEVATEISEKLECNSVHDHSQAMFTLFRAFEIRGFDNVYIRDGYFFEEPDGGDTPFISDKFRWIELRYDTVVVYIDIFADRFNEYRTKAKKQNAIYISTTMPEGYSYS